MICFMRVTAFCNMGCDHCIQPEKSRNQKGTMSHETVEKVASMLKEIQERRDRPVGNASILFQGGEVMAVPVEWYRETARILDDILPGHIENMQTSLIPYTKKWAPFVHERLRGVLGTSIDFSARKLNGSSEAYIRLWLDKVRMAREDGISLYPITVITKQELGKESFILEWFLKNGFEYVTMEKFVEYGEMCFSEMTTNAEFSEFLIRMWDLLLDRLRKGERVLYVNPIMQGIRGILYGVPGHKWGVSCLENTLSVFPDGSLHSCPPRSAQESYGNLSEGHGAFLESPIRIQNIREYHANHTLPECFSCHYHAWCQSGCPIERLDGDGECTGFKRFLDYLTRSLRDHQTRVLAEDYVTRGSDIESKGIFAIPGQDVYTKPLTPIPVGKLEAQNLWEMVGPFVRTPWVTIRSHEEKENLRSKMSEIQRFHPVVNVEISMETENWSAHEIVSLKKEMNGAIGLLPPADERWERFDALCRDLIKAEMDGKLHILPIANELQQFYQEEWNIDGQEMGEDVCAWYQRNYPYSKQKRIKALIRHYMAQFV